jgi:hypothetical protein
MISPMSLRLGCCLVLFALGCGGTQSDAKEPKTAKEKQLADMKASGELDEKSNGKWAGWRYSGERKDCRFVIGRRCFKTEKAACDTTSCRSSKCDVFGAGPATVTCKRDEKTAEKKAEKAEKKK